MQVKQQKVHFLRYFTYLKKFLRAECCAEGYGKR